MKFDILPYPCLRLVEMGDLHMKSTNLAYLINSIQRNYKLYLQGAELWKYQACYMVKYLAENMIWKIEDE